MAGQQLITRILTGPISCVDGTFGAPTTNYQNFCWVSSELATTPAPTTWTECAREGGTCNFTGSKQIKYGGKLAGQQSIIKTLTGPISCTDGTFGAPFSNYENFCWIGSTTTPPPASGPGPRVTTFTPSGPIVARSGQVIAGLSISNPNGDCVTVSGVSNVVIRDSRIGPCGDAAVEVMNGSTNVTIEYNAIANSGRGVRSTYSSNVNTTKNTVGSLPPAGEKFRHAIEYSWTNGGRVDGNEMKGSFPNDVLSGYESDNLRFVNNVFDVTIAETTGAPFTIGDSTTGHPGANNYLAGNVVLAQSGGVPPGVFGSNGNTVLEKNCLRTGLQIRNLGGVFTGVTVQKNVINQGPSFYDPGILASVIGWSTNVNSTNCSLMPQ